MQQWFEGAQAARANLEAAQAVQAEQARLVEKLSVSFLLAFDRLRESMRDPVLVLNSIASASPPSSVISYDDFVFLATLLNWDSPLNLALNDGEKRTLKEWVELMLPASSSSAAGCPPAATGTIQVVNAGSLAVLGFLSKNYDGQNSYTYTTAI